MRKKTKTKAKKTPSKPKAKKAWNWQKYIFAAARKTWRWSPARREVLKAAKHGEFYRCNACRKYVDKVEIDHIQEVTDPTTGFTTWDSYFDRLFCPIDNLQALCPPCHKMKTQQMSKLRRESKKKLTSK